MKEIKQKTKNKKFEPNRIYSCGIFMSNVLIIDLKSLKLKSEYFVYLADFIFLIYKFCIQYNK